MAYQLHPDGSAVQYGDSKHNVIDIWVPAPGARVPVTGLPVLVYVHGGGWRKGRRDYGPQEPLFTSVAADENLFPIAFATIDYRKFYYNATQGPEETTLGYRFGSRTLAPAFIRDTAAALQYLKTNASRWNLNADKIIGWGSSAGAVNILAAALSARAPFLRGPSVRGAGPFAVTEPQTVSGLHNHWGATRLVDSDPEFLSEPLFNESNTVAEWDAIDPARKDSLSATVMIEHAGAGVPIVSRYGSPPNPSENPPWGVHAPENIYSLVAAMEQFGVHHAEVYDSDFANIPASTSEVWMKLKEIWNGTFQG